MKYLTDLTQEIVRELLDYDPATGALTWRQRDRKWFESDGAWKMWNTKYSGKRIYSSTTKGYLRVKIWGHSYAAHRLCFLWMTGRYPDPEIDHENHVRSDNRWSNLFETGQNNKNRTLPSTNTSGHIGVYKHSNMYGAYIHNLDSSREHLGYFHNFEDAVDVRSAAELKYNYHKRHGERRGE
jgi:hypothetical protein